MPGRSRASGFFGRPPYVQIRIVTKAASADKLIEYAFDGGIDGGRWPFGGRSGFREETGLFRGPLRALCNCCDSATDLAASRRGWCGRERAKLQAGRRIGGLSSHRDGLASRPRTLE